MRIGEAGEKADPGLWIDPRTLRIHLQELGDGPLPGAEGTRWVRVPILLWIVLGPLLGFVYVVVLPFVGAGLVARELVLRIRAPARRPHPRGAAPPSR